MILSTFFAATQVFNLVTPEAGLPFLLFNVFLFVLLVNTLAGASRSRLRAPQHGRHHRSRVHPEVRRARRDLRVRAKARSSACCYVLLEGVTLGTLTQPQLHPAAGYLAFATLVLFLIGLAMLPTGRAAWR